MGVGGGECGVIVIYHHIQSQTHLKGVPKSFYHIVVSQIAVVGLNVFGDFSQ